MNSTRYDALGVSAAKDEVHSAIRNLDKGLYPLAFCKVLPDFVGGQDDFVNLIHADTAGTKTSLAYLYWKETGDVSVWKGIAQDALVMNVDDLACVGCVDNVIISSTIGRNKHLIPGAAIQQVIEGTQEFIDQMTQMGMTMYSGGGETADVGDIVRTMDVGITAFARMAKKDLIVNNILPGQVIVGFASYGQAVYEKSYNSGIGSNGLTAARHDVLHKDYSKYAESYADQTNPDHIYTGPYRLTDQWSSDEQSYEVGKLLLSPTRTYLPLVKEILAQHKPNIHGMVHCTGGAQTKVKKFINPCKIIKDQLFDIPPVFQLLKSCTLCTPQEMYQVYNMGHRLEIYTDLKTAEDLIAISQAFSIDAKIIGRVEASENPQVFIVSPLGEFLFRS